MRLVPNIRSLCQTAAKKALEAEGVHVMDGFSQTVTRFLFQPAKGYGEDGEVIVVETMLTDGSRESKSNFKKNKGIFGFTHAQDLDEGVEPKEACSFLRDDGTAAVVRMWCVNVPGLEKAFDMVEVKAVGDLQAFSEQVAYNDFHQALSNLLGPERVQQGSIWKCTQRKAVVNEFLAVEGHPVELAAVLRRLPLITRHYFRLSVSEEGGKVAFHANLGFGQKSLDVFPGSNRCVLYLRQGSQIHAMTQGLPEFVLDRRMSSPSDEPAPVIETSSCSGFGQLVLKKQLGGSVYEMVPVGVRGVRGVRGQACAVKLTSLRINESGVEREKQILQRLGHGFLQVQDCFAVLPKWYGADMERVFGKKGVVMELIDKSLQDLLGEGAPLDVSWLLECRPLIFQMAKAVQYMHSQGVLHGNLKPGNVLLRTATSGFDIVISDFSCAVEAMEEGRLLSRPRGAAAYQAPQMRAQPPEPYSLKADVYSLGRTFQALLQRMEVEAKEARPDAGFSLWPLEVREMLLEMHAPSEANRPDMEMLLTQTFFGDFLWGSCRFNAMKDQSH